AGADRAEGVDRGLPVVPVQRVDGAAGVLIDVPAAPLALLRGELHRGQVLGDGVPEDVDLRLGAGLGERHLDAVLVGAGGGAGHRDPRGGRAGGKTALAGLDVAEGGRDVVADRVVGEEPGERGGAGRAGTAGRRRRAGRRVTAGRVHGADRGQRGD